MTSGGPDSPKFVTLVVPGDLEARTGGYGYDVRTQGLSSRDDAA